MSARFPSCGISNLDSQVESWLSADLDDWTRQIIRRHFSQEGGSPYWLDRAAELPFDPRDITRYAQLTELGPFPLDELRTRDPMDFVPRDIPRQAPGRIWESGGTTGTPCKVFYTDEMMMHRGAWRVWGLAKGGIRPGGRWLQALPTGPHLIGNIARDLVEQFSAMVHCIDMDPRWVKRLIRAGMTQEANEYSNHLVEQVTDTLLNYQVDYLSTTSVLCRKLISAAPEPMARLNGIFLSGTQITPLMHNEFKTALGDDTPIVLNYGNTFGNSVGLPAENNGRLLPYLPQYPHVTTAVVASDDWKREVDYGRIGRVRLTVLHPDLLAPNILERDQAIRYAAGDFWPADGVANVAPLRQSRAAPEGVYL